MASSRGKLRLVTRTAAGRRAGGQERIQYVVSASDEPPAPRRHASAPVRAQWSAGRNASRASPLVMGSLAEPRRRPPRFEMQLTSPSRAAQSSSSSNSSRAALSRSILCVVTSPPSDRPSPLRNPTTAR